MSNNHGKWIPAEVEPTADSFLDNMHYTSARRKSLAAAVNTPHDENGFGKSRTEIFAEATKASKVNLKKLSEPRQEYLESVASRSFEHHPRANLDSVLGSSTPPLIKTASTSGGIPSHTSGGGSVTAVGPELYSPLYLTANLMLPRDRITANAWNRAFYETNPLVRNAINLHATYPISKLNIKCENKKVEQFFEDLAEKVDLISVVQNTASEYWKLGEKVSKDTVIKLADSSTKLITEIVIGDEVITHTGARKKVIGKFVKPTKDVLNSECKIYEIKVLGQSKPLIISGKHPVLSVNRGHFVCVNRKCSAKGIAAPIGRIKCPICNKPVKRNISEADFINTNRLSVGDEVFSPALGKVVSVHIESIRDITETFTDEFMYDLEVEDDHSYVADGIAVHNCFNYAAFDSSSGTWDKIYQLNPDFVVVKQSPIPGVVTIALRPDPELQKIVHGNDSVSIKMRQQLPDQVIHHVMMNEPIPLDSFNVSHLKNLSSPYDVRGTSIIVSVWKDLVMVDKYKECFDKDTEVLTRDGFKKYHEVICRDSDGIARPVDGLEVACYNPETQNMEFAKPLNAILKKFDGDMLHFKGDKIDCMVTPNHRLYASKKTKKGWQPYGEILAKDIPDGTFYKFKCNAGWEGSYHDDFIEIADKEFPMDLYLKFLGYLVSEGCLQRRGYNSKIFVCQATSSNCFEDMRDTFEKVAAILGRKLGQSIKVRGAGFSAHAPQEMWIATLDDRAFCEALVDEIGTDGKTKSIDKRLPRWVFELPKDKIAILLNALVKGDGSESVSKHHGEKIRYSYGTISKQLCDDVYELVYRSGAVPNIIKSRHTNCLEYIVTWSNTNYGHEPYIYNNKDHGGANISRVPYNDNVWCFEVPTDLIITRRNGKVCIQHNCKLVQADSMVNPLTLVKIGASNADGHYPRGEELAAWRDVFEQAQYNKDFKIFTHPDVNVTPVGYSGQTLDINQDLQLAMDNILTGLMVPKSIMTQEGAPYANASVALDVMRQRYNNFRTMMANWLEKKIFAPISEVQGFYKYDKGEKRLIVPTVEWNHMTLYDVDSYINQLMQLIDKAAPTSPGGVSRKTLYRSLGLNFQDEVANIKKEFIDLTILQKEMMELQKMELSKLRSLDADKPIVETQEPGLPGAPGGPMGAPPGGPGDLGGLLGAPGGDLGAMPGGPTPTEMGAPPGGLPGTPPEMPPMPGGPV